MDISGAFEVDGIVRQKQELESLLMSNPEMEKKVQGLIRKVLLAARREISGRIKDGDYMKSDPRQAYKAVKSAVYRRILGGNVSILNKRRAGKRGPVPPIVHKLETQVNSKGNHRGGNRMPRSRRTEDRNSHIGHRGAISARSFFADSSQQAMQKAAEELDVLIERLIEQEMK